MTPRVARGTWLAWERGPEALLIWNGSLLIFGAQPSSLLVGTNLSTRQGQKGKGLFACLTFFLVAGNSFNDQGIKWHSFPEFIESMPGKGQL